MQKNDKITCRIVNYIPHEKTFEVEDLTSRIRGYVIFVNNSKICDNSKNEKI